MTGQSFSLIPFPAPTIPAIKISGNIARENNSLALHYLLAGNMEEILLPSPLARPSRKDELWKMTCFEFFVAIKDQPQYWEFNMSPGGDWNVYRMDAYRRMGFREETFFQHLPFTVEKMAEAFTLDATVNLSPIFQPSDSLEVGITAIIQTKDGNQTYWALTHPAPQADFHLRESFIPAPAAQTRPLRQSAPGG